VPLQDGLLSQQQRQSTNRTDHHLNFNDSNLDYYHSHYSEYANPLPMYRTGFINLHLVTYLFTEALAGTVCWRSVQGRREAHSPGAEPADFSETPADETVDGRALAAEERPASTDLYAASTSPLSIPVMHLGVLVSFSTCYRPPRVGPGAVNKWVSK